MSELNEVRRAFSRPRRNETIIICNIEKLSGLIANGSEVYQALSESCRESLPDTVREWVFASYIAVFALSCLLLFCILMFTCDHYESQGENSREDSSGK
jgi:hypothetical protein